MIALPLAMAAGTASAKITQYECRFDQNRGRGGGWITELVYLTENDETGEILAYDPVIHHFVGHPVEARLSASTKVRKTFSWTVDTRNKGQAAEMHYTLSYFSNGQPAKLTAKPGGYDNTWKDVGKCTVTAQ